MIKKTVFTIVLVLALFLAGCDSTPAEQNSPANNNTDQNTQADNNSDDAANDDQPVKDDEPTPEPPPEPTPVPTTAPTEPPFDALPPIPKPVEFPSYDGRILEGFYYPAKVDNAPIVVLMHWAPGTMEDWLAIAPWLQNRGDELAAQPGGTHGLLAQAGTHYLDPTWFPPMPIDASFAVLTFNFGGYGNSQAGSGRQSFVDDAYSAVLFASSLEGVDPLRISALGASIGADGVVDACYLVNLNYGDVSCIGAFSLSPGNYLTEDFTYTVAAATMGLDGFPVWCLAAENDYDSPDVCRSLEVDNTQYFIYPGGEHGMELVTPEMTPSDPALDLNAMQLIQAWLDEVYGTALEDLYN